MLEQSYPREKMTTAVSILATHPGKIKERLFDAYIEFHTIGEDMPQPFQCDFQWIVQELNKPCGENGEGTVKATLNAMTEAHAVEIARRIYDLAFRLRNDQ